MNGWTAAVVSAVVAANAAALWWVKAWPGHDGQPWRSRALRDVALGSAGLVLLSVLARPLLDGLDVTTPTFRLAAATVIGLQGGRWLVAPHRPIDEVPDPGAATVLVALGATLSPGLVFAVLAGSADAGIGAGIVASLVAGTTLAAVLALPRHAAAGPLARLVGAGALVAAITIGLDAARTV